MSESLMGCGPCVWDALRMAGWRAGHTVTTGDWTRQLTAAGFELNDVAVGIWAEFGGLTIKSCPARAPASSLCMDPVDACIDTAAEAASLKLRYGENYSPLGTWSVQFRSYVAAGGRVVAVGPNVLWSLGSTFAEALVYVVYGDGGVDRAEQADWLGNCLTGR
ncbi:SUKH-3 domain-containing protein [Streptomyces odonnellii]|uniref:SUKH-3 domain-containing protein n=1 Tax=Streptomyces odonnellii TaxID=1417980 RepID=UPI000626CA0F